MEQDTIASLPFSKRLPNSLFLLFSAYSLLVIRDPSKTMVRVFFYIKDTVGANEIMYVESA